MTASEVCAVIERETDQKVTAETPVSALKCDSLEFVDLLMALGEAAGKEIPDSKWSALQTVGDIIAELA